MEILVAVIWFALGLALIIKGGDLFVDASGWISDVSGISKAVVGATLVSFATTAPEYFVSLIATARGATDLSIGNAVGSLSVNIGIAFGVLALCTPGPVKDRLFGVKSLLMVGSAVMLWFFCLDGSVSVVEGLLLIVLFGVSIFINIRFTKDDEGAGIKRKSTDGKEITINCIKFVAGAAGVIVGSSLMVDNGSIIAVSLGVTEKVIGLTIVAIGTSLPEIVTSVTAALKKQNALSIGNIVGANILDATLILSTGAFVSGGNLTVSESAVRIDIPVAVALMILASLPTILGKRLYRWQGAALILAYTGYIVYNVALS